MKKIILFFLFFSISSLLYSSTGAFLDIPVSPNVISMGGAGVAYPKGIENISINPANCISLKGSDKINLFISDRNYLLGTRLDFLTLAYSFSEYYSLGVSSRIFYDTSEGTAVTLNDGSYSGKSFIAPFNLCIGLTLAKINKRGNFYMGGRIKIIYQKFQDYTSMGNAIDIGIITRIWALKGILVGASLKNLGSQSTGYIEEKFSYPLRLKLGVCYDFIRNTKLYRKLVLTSDMDINFLDKIISLKGGASYRVFKYFLINAGYSFITGQDTILEGIRTGIEVDMGRYSIMYGGEYFNNFSYMHNIGIKTYI